MIERTELITTLKEEIQQFLLDVSSDTLNDSYEKLVALVLRYNGVLTIDDIYSIFSSIDKEIELNTWQEEVVWEVSSRLSGQCSLGKAIRWS